MLKRIVKIVIILFILLFVFSVFSKTEAATALNFYTEGTNGKIGKKTIAGTGWNNVSSVFINQTGYWNEDINTVYGYTLRQRSVFCVAYDKNATYGWWNVGGEQSVDDDILECILWHGTEGSEFEDVSTESKLHRKYRTNHQLQLWKYLEDKKGDMPLDGVEIYGALKDVDGITDSLYDAIDYDYAVEYANDKKDFSPSVKIEVDNDNDRQI